MHQTDAGLGPEALAVGAAVGDGPAHAAEGVRIDRASGVGKQYAGDATHDWMLLHGGDRVPVGAHSVPVGGARTGRAHPGHSPLLESRHEWRKDLPSRLLRGAGNWVERVVMAHEKSPCRVSKNAARAFMTLGSASLEQI